MIHNYEPSQNTKENMLDTLKSARKSLDKFIIHTPWGQHNRLNLRFEDYKKYKLDNLWQVNIINPFKDISNEAIGVLAIGFSLESLFNKIVYRLNHWEDFYYIYKDSNGRYRQ